MDTPDLSPTDLVPLLLDRLPELLDEVSAALVADWPDYARFLQANRAEVAEAADGALRHLMAMATLGVAGDEPGIVEQDLFEEIGRMQWRDGREISSLLSAFQLGARLFWRHVSDIAVERNIAPRPLASLAEGVFLFVDQLSSAAARGYVLEQTEAAATRERLREELVGLLLSERATAATVRTAAVRAGWTVPEQAAIVVVQPDSAIGLGVLARFDPACLLITRPQLSGAIVPNPTLAGRRSRLARALHGTGAVVSVTVPVERLPATLHVAQIASRLQRTGVLTEDPLFVEEHLDAIIVHRDPRMLDVFRAQMLRPVEASAPASRARLVETLASWLRHMGDRQAVAAELHVHPQTVRYRLARLHELYGDDLDDPRTRLRLTLALTWGEPRSVPEEPRGGPVPPS